jgi:hypothetical protein
MTRQEVGNYLGLTIKTVSRAFRAAPAGIVVVDTQEEVRVNDNLPHRQADRCPVNQFGRRRD